MVPLMQGQTQQTDTELNMVLPALFEDFVHYQNQKDMPNLLDCLHPESPAYSVTEQGMEKLFNHYTLQVSVLGSTFGGNDDTYAYYRFQQTIEKIAGPDFQNCEIENLIVFRHHKENWKIWNYQNLWIKTLE